MNHLLNIKTLLLQPHTGLQVQRGHFRLLYSTRAAALRAAPNDRQTLAAVIIADQP
jgi:hypothetical protein